MKAGTVLGIAVMLSVVGVLVLSTQRKPPPRWQPGSLISGNDPEEGPITREVFEVEWRNAQEFTVDRTLYPAQWWYRTVTGWYPEQFLLQYAHF